MCNIPHFPCGVIPPHILSRVAETAGEGRDDARATLEQMHELASTRTHAPIDHSILQVQAAPRPAKHRRVYNGQYHTILPGKLVRSDHKTRGGDVEVAEAWDGSGATYDFFAQVFGRDSIDGRGMCIDSTVHSV